MLDESPIRRLIGMIASAHDGGADAVMVTCSSLLRQTAVIVLAQASILSSPELALQRAREVLDVR
jgi:hypothetical protein